MSDPLERTEAEWQVLLTDEQYRVCRQGGTEPPFSSAYHDDHTPGLYRCVCCRAPLFHSEHKFDSGSGWPSYWQPVDPAAVTEHTDHSLGMARTEVRCASCAAHLGHVFPDGPPPTGQRYCINGVCLEREENVPVPSA